MEKQKTLFKDKTTMGVIISRMQVPYLTDSHRAMIDTIKQRHPRVAILLGVSKEISFKNPYPFDFRRQMVSVELREHDIIIPLPDFEDNKKWVENVDTIINSLLSPKEMAILYGGRDSFIPYYKKDGGIFATQELLPEDNDSGTELRNIGATKPPVYSKQTAESWLWLMQQLEEQEKNKKQEEA